MQSISTSQMRADSSRMEPGMWGGGGGLELCCLTNCTAIRNISSKAELTALTQALKLAEGTIANIYTDSRYVFALAHVHGSIYQEKVVLTPKGKTFKIRKEYLLC
jgi:ribonuclease HI